MPLRRPITLPKKFGGSKPGALKPADWNRMVDCLKSILAEITDLAPQSGDDIGIRQSSGGWVAYLKRRMRGGTTAPPYWPSLITIPTDPVTYEVTVTAGYVQETKTGTGDALAYHQSDDHYAQPDPPTDPVTYLGSLARFPIEIDEAVYVVIQLDANGRISTGSDANPITLEVAANDTASTFYQPKVDNDTPDGTSGTIRVKLAVLVDDVTVKLDRYMAGKHIQYAPTLPSIKTAAASGTGIGVIPQKWDNDANSYKLRAIKGLCGITVTQTTNEIEVKTSGDSFLVRLWEQTITVDYLTFEVTVTQPESPTQEFWILNGVWFLTEPDNWSECGGSSAPVYNFSYLAATGGGS